MRTLLTAIYALMSSASPFFRYGLGMLTVALAVLQYFNGLWAALFAKTDTMVAGTAGTADFSALGLINYVFPLDTVCTFISAYAGVRLLCATIRIIKSFIPTIA